MQLCLPGHVYWQLVSGKHPHSKEKLFYEYLLVRFSPSSVNCPITSDSLTGGVIEALCHALGPFVAISLSSHLKMTSVVLPRVGGRQSESLAKCERRNTKALFMHCSKVVITSRFTLYFICHCCICCVVIAFAAEASPTCGSSGTN